MKHFILVIVVLCVLSIMLFSVTKAESPTEATSVRDIIIRTSMTYGVKQVVMERVIACESGNRVDAVGDNGHSYGLSQIYLPAHPEITKEQALDPYFATAFMAEQLKKGNGSMWTCWRNIYN